MAKKYSCPYCDYHDISDKLIRHISNKHEDMIPKGYTAARIVYNIRNKRDHGVCMICKKETEWNETNMRYKPFCSKTCHDKYVKRFESNMIRVRGKARILDDPEQQAKMLANRKISGSYRFTDGGVHTYTGSFEHKTLEFLDKVLGVKSNELMCPGPTLEYSYGGKTHKWITDIYWIDLNLVIEVKDGGDNPNKREMISYREKQIEKERMITDKGEFNYLRLTNNNFEQLFEIIAEIKRNTLEDNKSPIIRINESLLESVSEVGPVGGMPNAGSSGYLVYKGFNGISSEKDDDNAIKNKINNEDECFLSDDLLSEKVVGLDNNRIPKSYNNSILGESPLAIYKFLGSKKRFLEVASKKSPIKSFYEELTGNIEYTKDQINFDPLFEKVNITKMLNRTSEEVLSIKQEYARLQNMVLPYLPVMNLDDLEKKRSILKDYKNINIAEDVDGYFLYNTKTKRRSLSVKDITELKVEDTSLVESDDFDFEKELSKELDAMDIDFDQEVLNEYNSVTSNDDRIDSTKDDLDTIEQLEVWSNRSGIKIIKPTETLEELEYDWEAFNAQHRKLQREADWKSQQVFGMTNASHYNQLKAKFLQAEKPKSTMRDYDGSSIPSEVTSEAAIPSLNPRRYTNELITNTFINDMPYFTPMEIDSCCKDKCDNEEISKWRKAYDKVFRTGIASEEFKELNRKRINALLENKLTTEETVAYGWNPVIAFTPKNRAKADIRLNEYTRPPIETDNKDIIIRLPKGNNDIKTEYQNTHDMLKVYHKNNKIKQMEYELVYMYHLLLKAKMLKDKEKPGSLKYKSLIDSIALIKNDIVKYEGIILEKDKNFNLRKTYEKSKYYNKEIRMNKQTIKDVLNSLTAILA